MKIPLYVLAGFCLFERVAAVVQLSIVNSARKQLGIVKELVIDDSLKSNIVGNVSKLSIKASKRSKTVWKCIYEFVAMKDKNETEDKTVTRVIQKIMTGAMGAKELQIHSMLLSENVDAMDYTRGGPYSNDATQKWDVTFYFRDTSNVQQSQRGYIVRDTTLHKSTSTQQESGGSGSSAQKQLNRGSV